MTATARPTSLPSGIRQLPSGSWNVTVSVPGQPRITKAFPRDQYAAAELWRAEQRAAKGQRTPRAVGRKSAETRAVSVAAYYGKWMAVRSAPESKARLAPTTERAYRSYFQNWILPAIGRMPMRDVTRRVVLQMTDGMGALEPSTRMQVVLALSSMFTYALEREDVAANPCASVNVRATKAKRGRVLAADEFERIHAAADEPYRLLYLLLWSTGCRFSEAVGLTMRDVDWEGGTIHVSSQLDGDGRRAPKGGLSREVPLPARLRAALESRRDAPGDQPLVRDGDGQPLRRRIVEERSWLALRAALAFRGQQVTLHSFRHGAVTHWLSSGVPVQVVKEWAGHSSLAVTNTYAHTVPGGSARYAALL